MKATISAIVLGLFAVAAAPASAQFGPPPPADPNAPTPRLANGKPDLTGSWVGVTGGLQGSGGDMFRRCTPFQSKNCMEWTNQSEDWVFMSATRLDQRQPLYKPEYWDKIIALDQWTNKEDPIMTCKPIGIPRHGTPGRILQTDHDVIFFYGANADYGGGNNEYRDIPTDGRARSKQDENLATFYGQSIGHWEGDTLVIDSTNFDDATWLGRGGFFHTGSMHIVEKLTRVGNELRYDMTVEDPEAFIEPWVMPTRVLPISEGQGALRVQSERANCEVYESGNETSQVRH